MTSLGLPTSASVTSRRSVLFGFAAGLASPAWARTKRIEIGVCNPIKNFAEAVSFGFEYFEPGVAEIATLSDSDFADFRKQVNASPLRCTSCNSFIRTLKVVGPEVDRQALQAYMSGALDRCRQLGSEIIVWGSAGSRNVPAGFSREKASDQIRAFLRQAGDVASKRNMIIAIEPLNKAESNIINTGAEALQFVREVNHPNVKMIIDYYHMRLENESPDILVKGAGEIVHLHFANPKGRRWPKLSDNDPGYGPFFATLKQVRYSGGISIEGRGTIAEDARDSLAFFAEELGQPEHPPSSKT